MLEVMDSIQDSMKEKAIETLIDFFEEKSINTIDFERFKSKHKGTKIAEEIDFIQKQYIFILYHNVLNLVGHGIITKIFLDEDSVIITLKSVSSEVTCDRCLDYEYARECLAVLVAFEKVFDVNYKTYDLKLK